jgi:pimeloyl-ACP methyl ester carboxylesterase
MRKFFFQDSTFSFEFLRILGESVHGGSDVNECLLTASRIKDGDVESWYEAWYATAERVHQIADTCLARGHTVSAREAYLRASNYYRSAEFFLYINIGKVDPRAMNTYEKSISCFRQGARLLPHPFEVVRIPYQGTILPGYMYCVDDTARPRPTLLVHGGYDSTSEEEYFGAVPAALARGYNCLIFDGPGQGGAIRLQNLPFRPDWEQVVTPVVDYVLGRPEIDPSRIILLGMSFGGYLAPRAAAFEHRLAACVAIDGLFSMSPGEEVNGGGEGQDEQEYKQMMQQSLQMRWVVGQGMWAMQGTSLLDLLQKMKQYTMEGIADKVTCPTLICDAAEDHFFAGLAKKLYDALTCPKTYFLFTADDAAENHCHVGATYLLNQRVFDWLDETTNVQSKTGIKTASQTGKGHAKPWQLWKKSYK